MPSRESFAAICFCPASDAAVQPRISDSLAWPPASATRSASDGCRRTTIIRWPIATALRSPSTKPRHADAPDPAGSPPGAPCPPAVSSRPAATARQPASQSRSGARRIRIQVKVPRIRKAPAVPPGGGDHRRVVGAERERREPRLRQRRPQLRVRRDPADDRDRLVPLALGGRLEALDERPHDRALVRGGEVGAPLLRRLAEIA